LWDHEKLEEQIYESSGALGAAKYELSKSRGERRDLTMNDATFLTFGSRDAVQGSRNTALEKRLSDSRVRMLESKVVEAEAKVTQLLSQKDAMRRGGALQNEGLPTIRSAFRIFPRVSDIEVADKGTLETWRLSALTDGLDDELKYTAAYGADCSTHRTGLGSTLQHVTYDDVYRKHRARPLDMMASSSVPHIGEASICDNSKWYARGHGTVSPMAAIELDETKLTGLASTMSRSVLDVGSSRDTTSLLGRSLAMEMSVPVPEHRPVPVPEHRPVPVSAPKSKDSNVWYLKAYDY